VRAWLFRHSDFRYSAQRGSALPAQQQPPPRRRTASRRLSCRCAAACAALLTQQGCKPPGAPRRLQRSPPHERADRLLPQHRRAWGRVARPRSTWTLQPASCARRCVVFGTLPVCASGTHVQPTRKLTSALQLTAAASVVEAYDATPSVRFLRLRVVRLRPRAVERAAVSRDSVASRFAASALTPACAAQDDARFTFAPGQWLDLWPAGHSAPGGYSIASTPAQHAADRTIELAVRPWAAHRHASRACGRIWSHADPAPTWHAVR
jgi:hypothetical protein